MRFESKILRISACISLIVVLSSFVLATSATTSPNTDLQEAGRQASGGFILLPVFSFIFIIVFIWLAVLLFKQHQARTFPGDWSRASLDAQQVQDHDITEAEQISVDEQTKAENISLLPREKILFTFRPSRLLIYNRFGFSSAGPIAGTLAFVIFGAFFGYQLAGLVGIFCGALLGLLVAQIGKQNRVTQLVTLTNMRVIMKQEQAKVRTSLGSFGKRETAISLCLTRTALDALRSAQQTLSYDQVYAVNTVRVVSDKDGRAYLQFDTNVENYRFHSSLAFRASKALKGVLS
jgi:hypothetical protein